jgi:alpha/beta superfamily hydrolase
MRAATRRETVRGPAGRIECAVDEPQGTARGLALIAHPHPLHGGTLDNKVVQTLARALVELGYETWRPNFRGVGDSEGTYDEGRGELEDLASVFNALGNPRAVLAGFSFGGAMAARLSARVKAGRVVLVAPAVGNFPAPNVPPGTLVIHGEQDETVPLAQVLDWARPQELPVLVVPGAEHFFHRKLHVLRAAVEANWRAG